MIKIMKWLNKKWTLFIATLFVAALIPITYSYIPQVLKYLVDIVLKQDINSKTTLPKFITNFFDNYEGVKAAIAISIFLLIFQLLRSLIMFLSGISKGLLKEEVGLNMRTVMFSHIQNLDIDFHNKHDVGDLIQRCTSDIESIGSTLAFQIPGICYAITAIAVSIYQMVKINIYIMLVTLIFIPIILIVTLKFYKFIKKRQDEIEINEAEMTTVLEESINGVRVVKSFNREQFEIERFNQKSKSYKDKSIKLGNAHSYYWAFTDGLILLQHGITIIFCIIFARKGLISSGDIISASLYISSLLNPVRYIGRTTGDIARSVVSARRIDDILIQKSEYVNDGTLTPLIKGNIEFKNVSFKFNDSKDDLFNNISFSIKENQTIAIVGKSGCGKSTLASILIRLHEYTKGSILIEGVELKDISKKHLREKIGVILQESFLYGKSIYDNISIAHKEPQEKVIYDSAKDACIHDDINKFDLGYNTLVGEKGVTLSGGQKQRVAIARMLSLKRNVVIFDDSLSAVDTQTDINIRKALKKHKGTNIIITHRITTAKSADKIIVINNNTIEDIGTHEELLKKKGLYSSLWNIQGSIESEFNKLVLKEVSK